MAACAERAGSVGHGDDVQLVDVKALAEQKRSQAGGVMHRFLQFLGIQGDGPQRCRFGDAAQPLDLTDHQLSGRGTRRWRFPPGKDETGRHGAPAPPTSWRIGRWPPV